MLFCLFLTVFALQQGRPETKLLDYEAVPGLAPSKNLDKARKYVSAGKKAKLAHPVNTSGMCVLAFVSLRSHCSYL